MPRVYTRGALRRRRAAVKRQAIIERQEQLNELRLWILHFTVEGEEWPREVFIQHYESLTRKPYNRKRDEIYLKKSDVLERVEKIHRQAEIKIMEMREKFRLEHEKNEEKFRMQQRKLSMLHQLILDENNRGKSINEIEALLHASMT